MVITGAGRGIGAEVACRAAARGYDLCLGYRSDREAIGRVRTAAEAEGARVVVVQGDVAEEGDVVALFEACRSTFGPPDAVVINAGIVARAERLENFEVDRMRRVFDVNILGALLTAREAVRAMSTNRDGRGGSIVNVSSAASYLGSPGEFIDYAASKGAMDSATIGLAKEVAAEGIRVNAVRPGLIDTDIHASAGLPNRVAELSGAVPMLRGGTAGEVADAILWLASHEASYVTGSLLNVSGGR